MPPLLEGCAHADSKLAAQAGDLKEYGSNGFDPLPDEEDAARNQMVLVAAFAGDLFCLGILAPETYHAMALFLIEGLATRSGTHVRALYGLLLRAKHHTGRGNSGDFLNMWKTMIIVQKTKPFFADTVFGRKWMHVRLSSTPAAVLGGN